MKEYDIYNTETFPDRRLITTGWQGGRPKPVSHTFLNPTEEEEYNTSKGYFSEKYWKYANSTPIDYQLNIEGFRADKEFDEINWAETSVIIGCSFVFGHCIENESTISEILTREYGIPCVNGGQPGAGNQMIHHNAITFMKKYNPKNVIILWSYPARYTWMDIKDDMWVAEHVMPTSPISKKERKHGIIELKIPSAYYEIECNSTIYDWMVAKDIHTLLGNPQYNVCDKYLNGRIPDDPGWIKPKDLRFYDKVKEYDALPLGQGTHISLEELQRPEIYDMINRMYARDIKYYPELGRIQLNHYGSQINRDIADLIYRENFK